MIFAFQTYLSAPTMVTREMKSIDNLEREILITVCKINQVNFSKVSEEFGYKNARGFLVGKIPWNESLLAWNGFRNYTVNETFQNIFDSDVNKIYFDDIENVQTKFFLPYGFCKVGNIIPLNLSQKLIYRVKIDLKRNDTEFVVYVSDPSASVHFQLPYDLITGDRITIKGTGYGNAMKFYNVRFNKMIRLQSKGNCAEYHGNSAYQSYSECVANKDFEAMKYAFGCIVPWMSESDQCSAPIMRLDNHDDIIHWIKKVYVRAATEFKYKSDNCLPPCTVLYTVAKYVREQVYKNNNKLYISFSEDIETSTEVLAYDFSSLLVEIGGSMGLWLGFSVLGVFDLLISAFVQVRAKMSND